MNRLRAATSALGSASTSYSCSGSRYMAAGLHSSAANQTAGPDLFDADADAGAAFVGLPKLLVFGGNGYVGSHVCQQGIRTGVPVVSVSRSGRPGNADSSWADQVEWETGDAGDASTYRHLLSNCMGVISCIGGFGSNATMLKVNGEANVSLVKAAAEAGVPRFAFISAHPYNFPGDLFLLKGYFQGKRDVEEALRTYLPSGGVYLQPGFVHGTRKWGSVNIPLGLVGNPLQRVLEALPNQTLAAVPLAGALFVPPTSAETVAKAAVAAATDPSVPAGAMDTWAMAEYQDSG